MSEPAAEIKRNILSDRGFVGYGDTVTCTYGTAVEVYESSSAEGPHVWLKMRQDSQVFRGSGSAGEAHAHLSADQAREVIARLQAFLDDIPARWGGDEGEGGQ